MARPTSAPRPRATRIPTVSPWLDPTLTPTSTFPQREITPAVDRSMPACMTTSICPTAAIARIVPYGRMYDHDVFSSVLGAKSAATTRSAAIASQMGRKRAATSALATTCAERPIARGVGDGIPVTRGAHGPLDPERQNGEEPAATRCPFCAPRARSVNRDRTHAARRPPDPNVPNCGSDRGNPLQHGQVSAPERLTPVRRGCLCSLYIRQRDAACRRRACPSADAISMFRRPRRVA